ncbi:ribosomal protein S15 [Polytolypa hystricis UAMH7299]|uniref:Ribosomal protein S15 n=1 Tax=Polytolypa hystricis (strain UAMH7299) TaxID=1447883 RepID=A0A2B7XQV7_POLH7|nr:ribosomal protein S15 [Polytolypa hystricis UAMH7299]
MPPRALFQPSNRAFNVALLQAPFSALSLTSCASSSRSVSSIAEAERARNRRIHDPYAIAQARQQKAANLSRQKALKEERAKSLGDPVIGDPTSFTQSLQAIPTQSTQKPSGASAEYLNYFVTPQEFEAALARSKNLTTPVDQSGSSDYDPQLADEELRKHDELHKNAQEALNRIVRLGNGSNKDFSRVNIQRCIEKFGRHNTDSQLPPKPASVAHASAPEHPSRAPRAGPDTGSSEVQIAVLTSKILVLAKQMERTGHKDKHNKRNLRVLVHKRQKLLNYLRRKERGGPRWQHLVENLGLKDASFKGEISM